MEHVYLQGRGVGRRIMTRTAGVVTASVVGLGVGVLPAPPASAWVASTQPTCRFPVGEQTRTIHTTRVAPQQFIDALDLVVTAWNASRAPVQLTIVDPSAPADLTVGYTTNQADPLGSATGRNCGTPQYTSQITLNFWYLDYGYPGGGDEATDSVLTHEIAVAMGLGRSGTDACASIMAPEALSTNGCSAWLKPDDLVGLRALYTPADVPTKFPDSSFMSDQINGRGLHAPDVGGATVYDYKRTGQPEQLWSFLPVTPGSSWGYIVNTRSGWCLDIGVPDGSNFAPVRQSRCASPERSNFLDAIGAALGWSGFDDQATASQMWKLEQMDNGAYKIRNQFSNNILDVAGFAAGDGALVGTYADNGGYNQWWRIG
jgi:hypothetical protein